MNYRRWTLIAAVAAIVAVIWLIESDRMMGPVSVFEDSKISSIVSVEEKARQYPQAQELVGIAGYVNSPEFKLADFIGKKVILIDFWTYSCINCQRTTPYLRDWWSKYEDDGLLIVGVHTPEFEFEKDEMNVRTAVANFGIGWPVVQDNDYATWRAYGNQYWPRKYLIDADGYIVYDHIGEGGYDETERHIQEALAELKEKQGLSGELDDDMGGPQDAVTVDYRQVRTPEIYLGAFRNADYLGNATPSVAGEQTLTMTPDAEQDDDTVYLSGTWDFDVESARCISNCRLRLTYSARQVNIVAKGPGSVRVLLDGQPWGTTELAGATLYTVVDGDDYGEHVLELEFEAGQEVFTFTFG